MHLQQQQRAARRRAELRARRHSRRLRTSIEWAAPATAAAVHAAADGQELTTSRWAHVCCLDEASGLSAPCVRSKGLLSPSEYQVMVVKHD